MLNIHRDDFSPEDFKLVLQHHGIIGEGSSQCDPFAIIVKYYRLAAQQELPDGEEAAIYWWGVASNMARASPDSGFTVGELRAAISKAEEAERSRDSYLFGDNEQQGGSYEMLAKATAMHFIDESDSFVLPQVEIERDDGGSKSVSLRVNNEIVCANFDAAEKISSTFYVERNKDLAWTDTSELEKEHGYDASAPRIPPLQTLCVRELHKAGCEFAAGESDPAVIHYKALMVAAQKGGLQGC